MKHHNFGWLRDKHDERDWKYAPKPAILQKLPPIVDMRASMPAVYDQLDMGSCTANAINAAFQFNQIKQGVADFIPSRLFVYYNEREMEGTVNEDAGAQIRDGIKSVAALGVCPETEWPYDREALFKKPADECYVHALEHQVVSYHRINQDVEEMRACLAEGYPFAFGFMVFPSFETRKVAESGVASMPNLMDKIRGPMGGHAVLAVGYYDNHRVFIVRNSWGAKWGQAGYFSMPYDYLADPKLASDFWTVRTVEAG